MKGLEVMRWFRSALFSLMISAPASLFAQSQIPVEVLTGNFEIAEIDRLITENASDPEVAFDLLVLKAEAQFNSGSPKEAAETHLVMAALVTRFPDAIDADLPSILQDTADLFLEAGDTAKALEQLYTAVQALRDRAARADVLGSLLNDIADLEEQSGKPDVANQLRAQASALAEPTTEPPSTRSNDPGFATVDVFFATDRAKTGRSRPARFFGHQRDGQLNYGVAEVTIPRTHQPGTVATPTVWRLEFMADPAKHVMLQSIETLGASDFFETVRSDLAEKSATDAFVFVHGYNVSFDAAAKRTAQLAYDMNFSGVPILYSWPSRGATTGYIADTAVVRHSGRRLTQFLEDFVSQTGAKNIHIIAHSMGNRAVTDALELMAVKRPDLESPVFGQVIFAAPDVDRGLFNAMLPTIRPLARRLTLYASEHDRALAASRKLHGSAPRAGQGGIDLISNPAIDAIDMSELGDDMLAHSYVSNDQSALLDISTLFWLNPSPDARCGLVKRDEALAVWDHRDSTCANQSLLNIVSGLRNARAFSRTEVRDTLSQTFEDAPEIKAYESFLFGLTETR